MHDLQVFAVGPKIKPSDQQFESFSSQVHIHNDIM